MIKQKEIQKEIQKKKTRPIVYNELLVETMEQYLIDYEKEEAVPTIEGLILYIIDNIEDPKKRIRCRETFYEYEKKYPRISDIGNKIRLKQGRKLLTGGLTSDYNATIARLMLSKHGYKEEQKFEHTVGTVTTDEQVEKIANRISTRKGIDGGTSIAKTSN